MTREEFCVLRAGDRVAVSGFSGTYSVAHVIPRSEDNQIAKVRLEAHLVNMLVTETLAFKLTKAEVGGVS